MTHGQPALADLLGQWVTATNPVNGTVWLGQLAARADYPTLTLNFPGGGQVCLPQTFTVHPAAEPAQHTSADTTVPRPFLELRDTGLLWLINRVALHPRGLSLALHVSGSSGVFGWSLLRNDDNEPWSFDPATDSDGHARAEATLAAAFAVPPGRSPGQARRPRADRPCRRGRAGLRNPPHQCGQCPYRPGQWSGGERRRRPPRVPRPRAPSPPGRRAC